MGAVSLDFLPQFQVRVKLRTTQYEYMFSALPPDSDIARRSRHVSKVPKPEVGGMHRLRPGWLTYAAANVA